MGPSWIPHCEFCCKIPPDISYQRSALKPFLLYFFSEMGSGPGASSQIRIWEYATDQVIRVIQSVTWPCVCVCVDASCSPEDRVLKIRTAGKPCHWLLDMETKQLGMFQPFVCPPSNKNWWVLPAMEAPCCQWISGWFTSLLCWYHWHTLPLSVLLCLLSFNWFCFCNVFPG